MLRRLLPRETTFFDYFERHAELTIQGAREFLDLVSTPGANVVARGKRIKEIEHEADVVTHQCVEALHKTFVTPLDREDIHRLITRMDDIMDFLESAADQVALYELRDMTEEVRSLADVLVRAVEHVAAAVRGLRDLRNSADILKRCIEINRLENEGDTILRTAVARLFREEKDPLQIVKWKEIYEDLEDATDRCEDVANIVEGVVLEHA
jgi:predicted phosphate transport protein (TIGR00153 family)